MVKEYEFDKTITCCFPYEISEEEALKKIYEMVELRQTKILKRKNGEEVIKENMFDEDLSNYIFTYKPLYRDEKTAQWIKTVRIQDKRTEIK